MKHVLDTPFNAEHNRKASVIEVQTPDDILAAARVCSEGSIPMVVRGEGTGYTAGSYNFSSGVVLDTVQMNRVVDLDASKGTMTVQSGITVEDAREVALTAGWDLRHYPTAASVRSATIGGFLQVADYGLGSIRYGRTTDIGNIVNMEVVPIVDSPTRVQLDGADDRDALLGCLRTLGTSAIVSEVTLALAPSQFWVDAGITFPTFAQALEFSMKAQATPGFDLRECAVFPSSMLTSTLNQGERKQNINFFRNKVPMKDHITGESLSEEDAKLWPKPERQTFMFPSHAEETEAVVLMSINEAAIPFLNLQARETGGHTVYLEHNRNGFGWIDAVTWQQAAHRLSKYYNDQMFSHYELDLGSVSLGNLDKVEKNMEAVSDVIRGSILQKSEDLETYQQSIDWKPLIVETREGIIKNENSEKWIDETELLSKDIRHRPAWFVEMIRRPDGTPGMIAQVNWRTQADNLAQMGARITHITAGLRDLHQSGVIESFMDPHHVDPRRIFIDPLGSRTAKLAYAAKLRFDPKGLLNPRITHTKREL